MKYNKNILNRLYDIYQRRILKSSSLRQSVSIKITKEKLPEYFNDSRGYDEAFIELEEMGFIKRKIKKYDTVVEAISLNLDNINEIEAYLDRDSAKEMISYLLNQLSKYDDEVIVAFKSLIENKMASGKSIKQYLNNDYLDAARAIHEIELIDHEIFERDISNSIFKDSKRLNSIKSSIASIYNIDADDINDYLKSKGVVQVPSYLYIKGEGKVKVNNEIIDLAKLNAPIGICLNYDVDIEFINPKKVTTIENLTTFYDYKDEGLIIYLGGFATKPQLEVLKNLSIKLDYLYHFGDIDYGGYTILNNLISNLNCKVIGINMDLETILNNTKHLIPFDDTNNYISKLEGLLSIDNLKPYYEAINYLIKNKVWLEQESFYN